MASLSTTPRRLSAALLIMVVAGVVAVLGVRVVSALLSGTTASSSNSYTASSCFQPFPVTAGTGGNIFAPTPANIKVGCSVTWTQTSGGGGHNTTSDTGLWASANPMGQNNTFTYQFTSTGTYAYTCTRHPGGMKGTVVVTDP